MDTHPAPPGSLIGREGEGFARVMEGFDFSRALIALMCLGAAAASLDEATAYARERRSMGEPVSRASRALLVTGHPAYSADLPHGQRLRDIIGLEIGDGTAQIAKLVVARQLFGRGFAP